MKKINLVWIVILLSSFLQAQNHGEVHGKIVSQETLEPAIFAIVTLKNSIETYNATTDINGKFKFRALKPGTYSLRVTSAEYSSLSMTEIKVTPDKITFLNDLEMVGNTLPPIDITWTAPLVVKDNPQLISILTADIKQSANSKSVVGMISQLPGITSGNDNGELYFRGSRPQSINMYIDGVKLISSSLTSVPSNAIKTINVYTGGVPAAYGDITGGVIIIETKSYMDFYRSGNF